MTAERFVPLLDEYMYNEVWNYVHEQYRVNVLLDPIPQTYAISTACVGQDAIDLPTAREPYYVATALIDAFRGGLILPRDEWVTAVDVLEDTHTLAYMYPTSGRLAPRAHIQFYHPSGTKRVFIAVKRDIVLKCMGDGLDTVYMTLYRRHSNVFYNVRYVGTNIYIRIFSLTHDGSANAVVPLNAWIQGKVTYQLSYLVNGWERETLPVLSEGDVVEVIHDESIIGAYAVDVSAGNTGYMSPSSSSAREILHCPKSINPENYVITHNTCTLSVLDSNGRGVYLHRTEDDTLGQVTHNDLSVRSDSLEAYRDVLEDRQIRVRVQVRPRPKNAPDYSPQHRLIQDVNYLTFLYSQDDDVILRHLRGLEDTALDFWKAENLEESFYVRSMVQQPDRDGTAQERFDEYVTGLGYTTVAAILGRVIIESIGNYTATFPKPPTFQGRDVTPVVWNLERFLSADYSPNKDNLLQTADSATVIYDTEISLSTRFNALLLEGTHDENLPFHFRPTTNFRSIDVPFPAVRVYGRAIEDTGDPFFGNEWVYRELTEDGGNVTFTSLSSGETRVTTSSDLLGEDLFIFNRHGFLRWRFVFQIGQNLRNIIFPTVFETRKDPNGPDLEPVFVPPLPYEDVQVFLNGRKLIQGIDLLDPFLKTDDGGIWRVELRSISVPYLYSTNHYDRYRFSNDPLVEAFFTSQEVLEDEVGYTRNHLVSVDDDISNFIPEFSQVFVFGYYIHDIQVRDTHLEDDPYRGYSSALAPNPDGYPYQILTRIPSSLSDSLTGYDNALDMSRLAAIQSYFRRRGGASPTESDLIVTFPYQVYSPTVEMILYEVLDRKAFERGLITDDPDDTILRNSLLSLSSRIGSIAPHDHTLREDAGRFDRTYVDVIASPLQRTATVDEIRFLNRVLEVMLPHDPHARGDAY